MENINQEKWIQLTESEENSVILDVRTPQECAEGIQPDAELLNFLDNVNFISGLEKLDKSKTYFLYCRSGNRSAKACMIMDQMGFSKTYNLLGGMLEWKGKLVY